MRCPKAVVLVAGLVVGAGLRAQECINVSTGFDQDGGAILGPGVPDDDYTVLWLEGGAAAEPANTCPDGWPIEAGVWMLNDDASRWIGVLPTTTDSAPGTYIFEIEIFISPAVDASKAVLVGQWATDDGGTDVLINDTSTGQTGGGFGAWTPLRADLGLGLFVTGSNTIQFVVSNGGTADNPTGLRADACVEVPAPASRPYNVSTGFDEGAQKILGDDEADVSYIVTGPAGSGIGPVAATAVAEDGSPIPPWLANSVNSRWIGLASADSSGPTGDYTFRTEVTLPAGVEANRAILSGGLTADDAVVDIVINGTSTGIVASDFTKLSPFAVNAGQGLFSTGKNTIEFVVSNGSEGSVGLRVDGEVVIGPPIPQPLVSVLSLDTGYDNASRATIDSGLEDENYVIIGPPGSGVGPALATVVNDQAWPVTPGVWIASTAQSKWIGPAVDTNGPAGDYVYEITVHIPAGLDAAEMRMVGSWTCDNGGVGIEVNGTPTGVTNSGDFTLFTAFPPDAGKGLFVTGDNVVRFTVNNAPPGSGPTGLRVEGIVGLGPPIPGDISTGIGARGEGALPGGFEDGRYTVTGPAGSGIGPRPAVTVAEDGSPIPPWVSNSADSRWVGLDGDASSGPAGTYRYASTFLIPAEISPARAVLAGRWAAAGRGADIVLNGTPLGISSGGPGTLTDLPEDAGRDLFVVGTNSIEFVVENATAGSTGLRVEARVVAVAPAEDPLDISTAFDQSSAVAIDEGNIDDDYTVTDPFGNTEPASVVPLAPTPPWIANTDTSRWIGLDVAGGEGDPGDYVYETLVSLTAEQAAKAIIVGAFATDDGGPDVLINGTSTGLVSTGGFTSFTVFPPDFGRGLFVEGFNSIQFRVSNGGTGPNPTGLRVDAVIQAGAGPGEPLFRRGDANGDGTLNITDGIFVLNFLFLGGPTPGCLEAANANDDPAINITDGIYVLNFLFLGGPTPPDPKPGGPCGIDPPESPSALGCQAYPSC